MSEEIGRIFRRDIDRLPVLAAERWVPTKRRSNPFAAMTWRLAAVAAVIVLALGVGSALAHLRSDVPQHGAATASASPSASASASPSATPTPTPAATPTPTAASASRSVTFCGAVSGYAADGAHMLLTLTSRGTTERFNLQYQFATVPPPRDIGDRLATGQRQFVRVDGREVEPDSGSPKALTLRDFAVTRVESCP